MSDEEEFGRFYKGALSIAVGTGLVVNGLIAAPTIERSVEKMSNAYKYSNSPVTKRIDETDMSPDRYSGPIEETLFEPFEEDK